MALKARLDSLEGRTRTQQVKLNSLEDLARKNAVAFSARTNQSLSHSLNIDQNAAIHFTHVISNVGNGYNSMNGHFRALYSGFYMFFFSMRADLQNSDWIHVGIYKNRDLIALANADASSGKKGVALVITHLNVGDSVYCRRVDGARSIEDSWFTTFSGVLITSD